ncbi:MAG: hypothetical protein KDB84_05030 [Flavobacteriales bacterium]|nr:hypothetical protein [Flavobacteriales bacterium]
MRSLFITATTAVLLTAIPVSGLRAQGQQGSGSPYSAYGFGDVFNSPQVSLALMGVSGVALADPYSSSQINPASYVGLERPVFEAGGVGRFLRYEEGGNVRNGQRTDLLGLSIGVPFARNKWGFGFGLNPVSDVGYRITSSQSLASGGEVTYQYSGNGGLNRAYIGLGHTVWQTNDTLDRGNKLTIGANLNYLFGSVQELRKAYFPRSDGYYNTSASSDLIVRSPVAGIGVQFTGDLVPVEKVAATMEARRAERLEKNRRREEDWINEGRDPKEYKPLKVHNRPAEALRYRLGAAAELPAAARAKHTGLVSTFILGATGVEFPIDTAWYTEGARGSVDLPASYSVGAAVHNSRWTLTAEYRYQDWSGLEFRVEGYDQRTALGARTVGSLGASFRPSGRFTGSFWTRNTYRAGLRYSTDYRFVAGEQLREYGVSMGASFPLMMISTRSRFNVGVEYTKRGDAAGELLQESGVNLYLGVSITPEVWDQWFKKRRID